MEAAAAREARPRPTLIWGIHCGGSCTAGKIEDFRYYAEVCQAAVDAGLQVAEGVDFYIQFGSKPVQDFARAQGWIELFEQAGVMLINVSTWSQEWPRSNLSGEAPQHLEAPHEGRQQEGNPPRLAGYRGSKPSWRR